MSNDFLTKIDKSVITNSCLDKDNRGEKDYWLSKTPEERFAGLEILRTRFYNYDNSAGRFQRVLQYSQLK
ncbi:MAG TPA: hypothetical protein PK771_16135 [Spirochaetota bacterium]|nr:hypothetical protein [Spirochaetota bacterium]